MRKITQQAVEAFEARRSFKSGNTKVRVLPQNGDGSLVLLELQRTTRCKYQPKELGLVSQWQVMGWVMDRPTNRQKTNDMKYSDYLFLCNEHTINPNVAAQNPKVRKLLISDKGKNTVNAQIKLNTILQMEF